jgi:hypothetical protein|tara:strand:- start:9200 stop:9586 length:387 start_codon:yes stop_codon:yes gene_type:complete
LIARPGNNITMAKCDEGYLCDVCGQDVEEIVESDLYLRYVVGMLDPELLHLAPERHIRCNPVLAQFIVDEDFEPVRVEGDFDKSLLDPEMVSQKEQALTLAWRRLAEIQKSENLSILDYPLASEDQLR